MSRRRRTNIEGGLRGVCQTVVAIRHKIIDKDSIFVEMAVQNMIFNILT
jgi:hypothetical protein